MRPQTPLSRIFFQKVIGVQEAPSADDDENELNADQEPDADSESDGG